MSKRLTIEFIRSEFAKEGYILLTKVYKNNHIKLDYICPKGHRHSIIWNRWQGGKRCPYCYGNARLNIEFIRAEFEKEGYTLLTKVYKNNKQKLDFICSNGHKCNINWTNWCQGKRCRFCANNVKLTIGYIKSEFEKEGYILLTEIYENNAQKLEYICPKGHEGTIRWGNWQQGNRCLKCSGNDKRTIEFIFNAMRKEGYTLLSTECQNAYSKLYVKCPKGHCYYVIWNNWQQGKRCPSCPSKVSRWELEVKNYVKNLNVPFVSNNRNILINPNTGHNLELDIWFPQLNKAIECNGLYWHSKRRSIKNDKIKSMLCKKRNIDLLVLDDIEWAEDKPSCKYKIKNFITTKEAIQGEQRK